MPETKKNKGGRPKKGIDFEVLSELCRLHCTGEECASVLKVDYDTLNKRIQEKYGFGFSDYYKKQSGSGKVSLRRAQWRSALEGNVAMMIWLGKQYLGQTEKTEMSHNGGMPVRIIDDIPEGA